MKKSVLGAGIAVVLAAAAAVALAGPFGTPGTRAASALAFEARFETASDFFGRFDYGLSGQSPAGRDDPNVAGAGGVFPLHGDHDVNCGGPTTVRNVTITGEQWTNENHFPNINFDQLFWFCAPGGDPAKGHMMTAITTLGYNHLWFSPKPEFTRISKVCWDINETTEGGKWTEVQFVDHADATRYPTGTHTADSSVARGTGGFDLGYTVPDFRAEATGGDTAIGPNNGVQPRSGTLAGLHIGAGTIFDWFQNQDTYTARGVGWPGLLPNQGGNGGPITDKAARYTTCIENAPGNQIQITNNRPDGVRTYSTPGQIPQDARRVVFHDAEYDGPKRDGYSPDTLTWHWDNIQVFTDDGTGPAPTTVATTAAPTTVAPTTAAPTTMASTTAPTTAPTTMASTTAPTTAAPTTMASTTAPTTVAPTTVAPTTAAPTTVGPIDLTAAPTTAAPTTAAPTTMAPTTVAPATTTPTTAAPTTAAPTTMAPTTVAPATTTPTTAAPTTAAPTTMAPTTVAPATTMPTTAAPTTMAPTTVAPTTAAPTTTATTIAPTTTAAASAPAAALADTTPPVVTITGGPAGTTSDRDAVITFSATDPQPTQELSGASALTFTGSLDGGIALEVTSPLRIAALPLGIHELVIKATDQAGNVGSTRLTWTIVNPTGNLSGRNGSSLPAAIIGSRLLPQITNSPIQNPIRLRSALGWIKVKDSVVVRAAVPPPAEQVLPTTGAHTGQHVIFGLTLLGAGVVLAGIASGFRRRTA